MKKIYLIILFLIISYIILDKKEVSKFASSSCSKKSNTMCHNFYTAVENKTLEDCKNICSGDQNCTGFSYAPSWKQCRLENKGGSCMPGSYTGTSTEFYECNKNSLDNIQKQLVLVSGIYGNQIVPVLCNEYERIGTVSGPHPTNSNCEAFDQCRVKSNDSCDISVKKYDRCKSARDNSFSNYSIDVEKNGCKARKCTHLPNTMCHYNYTAVDNKDNLQECINECNNKSGCTGFSYAPEWRQCRLEDKGTSCNPGPYDGTKSDYYNCGGGLAKNKIIESKIKEYVSKSSNGSGCTKCLDRMRILEPAIYLLYKLIIEKKNLKASLSSLMSSVGTTALRQKLEDFINSIGIKKPLGTISNNKSDDKVIEFLETALEMALYCGERTITKITTDLTKNSIKRKANNFKNLGIAAVHKFFRCLLICFTQLIVMDDTGCDNFDSCSAKENLIRDFFSSEAVQEGEALLTEATAVSSFPVLGVTKLLINKNKLIENNTARGVGEAINNDPTVVEWLERTFTGVFGEKN